MITNTPVPIVPRATKSSLLNDVKVYMLVVARIYLHKSMKTRTASLAVLALLVVLPLPARCLCLRRPPFCGGSPVRGVFSEVIHLSTITSFASPLSCISALASSISSVVFAPRAACVVIMCATSFIAPYDRTGVVVKCVAASGLRKGIGLISCVFAFGAPFPCGFPCGCPFSCSPCGCPFSCSPCGCPFPCGLACPFPCGLACPFPCGLCGLACPFSCGLACPFPCGGFPCAAAGGVLFSIGATTVLVFLLVFLVLYVSTLDVIVLCVKLVSRSSILSAYDCACATTWSTSPVG